MLQESNQDNNNKIVITIVSDNISDDYMQIVMLTTTLFPLPCIVCSVIYTRACNSIKLSACLTIQEITVS